MNGRGLSSVRLADRVPWIAGGVVWLAVVACLQGHQASRFFLKLLREIPHPLPGLSFAAAGLWGRHALRAAAAAALLWTAWRTGKFLRRSLIREAGGEDVGSVAAETALGLAAWSLLGFFLALAGLSSPLVLRQVSGGAFLALALPFLKGKWAVSLLESARRPVPRENRPAVVFLAVAAAACLIPSVVPEIFSDALVYVLPVPEAYLRAGGLVDLPGNLITRYPGLGQTLYMWGLAWGDERVCKLLNAGIAGLWAAAAGGWVTRRSGTEAGLWTAGFLLSCPLVAANVWSCTFDPLAGLLVFSAFMAWRRAWEAGTRPSRRLLWTTGLLLGAAGAAKYTSVFVLPFFAVDAALLRRRGKLFGPADVFAFTAGGLLPLLPWWIRNWIWTGNPFHPYAVSFFHNLPFDEASLLSRLGPEQRWGESFLRRLAVLLVHSVTGIWEGRRAFIGPVFLALAPFVPMEKGSPARPLAAAAAVSYLAFAGATGMLRYFLPHMGFLAALAGLAMASLWRRSGVAAAVGRGVALALLAGQLLSLAGVFHFFFQGFDVVSGRVGESEYLRAPHPAVYRNPSQGAYDHLRQTASPGRVYLIGETRSFRCPGDPYVNWLYDLPLYVRWLREDPSPKSFVDRLKREGFTHVLLNPGEMSVAVVEDYRTPEWTARLEGALSALGPPVYQDAWTALFQVTSDRTAEGK